MIAFPTLEEVEAADRLQLARWYRFAPFPESEHQLVVINRICERFKAMGGFTPEISKQVGW